MRQKVWFERVWEKESGIDTGDLIGKPSQRSGGMNNIESLIRAATVLGCEASEAKTAATLMESGVSAEDAFLATMAAKILVKGVEK